MLRFFSLLLLEVLIILISFLAFSFVIPPKKRHEIWERYISSFSKFVLYIFGITVIINLITAFIVYKIRYERYLNVISPSIQSIIIGFVASCVPRRGVSHKKEKDK